MFMKFAQFEAKMAKAGGTEGAGAAKGGSPDYGAMMAALFEAAAKKQYEAAVKKEPAKANKNITNG
jgi:hypothetical protein